MVESINVVKWKRKLKKKTIIEILVVLLLKWSYLYKCFYTCTCIIMMDFKRLLVHDILQKIKVN